MKNELRSYRIVKMGQCLALAYAGWALPLLLALVLIVPPWTTTDEPFHMMRAVHIAGGHLLGERFVAGDTGKLSSGGPSNLAIWDACRDLARLSWLPNSHNGSVTRAILDTSDKVKWQRDSIPLWFASTVQYSPIFYMPDVVGYWIGRATGLHVNDTLRVARSLNAITFVVLAACAIADARRLRPLLVCILMLPMTLAMGASASQDAGLIVTAALVVARVDRLFNEMRNATPREITALSMGCAFIGMARPPYAGFVLLLPVAASGKLGLRAMAAAAAAIGAWCILDAAFVMVPIGGSQPQEQLRFLLMHPVSILTVPWQTFASLSSTYAWEFVGRLGWNDFALPESYLVLAAATLCTSTIGSMSGPSRGRTFVFLSLIFAVLTMVFLQYFDWTEPRSDHVDGIVGRYFIPIAAVAGLVLPKWLGAFRIRRLSFALLAMLAVATPAVTLAHVVVHYYVRST